MNISSNWKSKSYLHQSRLHLCAKAGWRFLLKVGKRLTNMTIFLSRVVTFLLPMQSPSDWSLTEWKFSTRGGNASNFKVKWSFYDVNQTVLQIKSKASTVIFKSFRLMWLELQWNSKSISWILIEPIQTVFGLYNFIRSVVDKVWF